MLMICAWTDFLGILPHGMKDQVDRLGRDCLRELRMRINAPPELVLPSGSKWLSQRIDAEDMTFCINAASRHSPWAASSISEGYLTIRGGHRIGICGEAVRKDGMTAGIRQISSLCIRIARDFPGISTGISLKGNVLILGAPGWGKTTLLRDLIRRRSEQEAVAVSDERGELFPNGTDRGKRTDVLTGVPKSEAFDWLLRTMGPDCIAMDEITSEQDCRQLFHAFGCGVHLMATAHAASLEDYLSRSVYKELHQRRIFDHIVILQKDKSFRTERIGA